MYEIIVKYHNKNIDKIQKIKKGQWIDLRAAETVELKAGESAYISLGVSIKIPQGTEAHLAPRSSTFGKWGVIQTNGVGVIDTTYCGEEDIWKMPVLAMRDTVINENDRICQFRIVDEMGEVTINEVDYMADENRGGFGSTGVN